MFVGTTRASMIYGTTGLQGVALVRMNRCFKNCTNIQTNSNDYFFIFRCRFGWETWVHAALMGCAGFAAFSLAIGLW